MEIASLRIQDIIEILGILFAVFHLLAGFFMYLEMVRINGVIKTSKTGFFQLVSHLYIAFLIFVLIVIVVI